jgi:hypothetical protein
MAITTPTIIGCWLLATSATGSDLGERVEVEFKPQGELVYATLENGKWSIMLLTYRVEGSEIVSNQPSAPNEERTEFHLSGTNELMLSFGGEQSSYTRIAACTFPTIQRPSLGILGKLKKWLS